MSRWLPAQHPSDTVIAATDVGAIVLNGVACFPWGFEFTIRAVPAPGRTEAMFWIEAPMSFPSAIGDTWDILSGIYATRA
jgi:hypothetical protein